MFGLFKARQDKSVARDWHGVIQSAARQPSLYRARLAQDTLEGRFQQVALVACLVLRRLRDFGDEGRSLADAVYREVFSGFDHALREEGVGDASIARKMRGLGEEFFGLARAIDAAFNDANTGKVQEGDLQKALSEILVRNGIIADARASHLASHVMDQAARLAKAEDTLLLKRPSGIDLSVHSPV
ncbi:MAG: ubiquinol-cytochrome C chaperone family protein [Pseudomonadota bacterium]